MKKDKQQRQRNLTSGEEALEILVAEDFKVEQFSEYHFRINNRLDVWPSSKKSYDIKSGEKQGYTDLLRFVRFHFRSIQEFWDNVRVDK